MSIYAKNDKNAMMMMMMVVVVVVAINCSYSETNEGESVHMIE